MPLTTRELTLPALRAAYAAGSLTPTEVCRQLLPAIAVSRAIFIARPIDDAVLERCRSVRFHNVHGRRLPIQGNPLPPASSVCAAGCHRDHGAVPGTLIPAP